MNSQPAKNGLSAAHKLFNRPICTNLPSVKPQPKLSTTKTGTEPETQNWLQTLKSGTSEEKTWDKKGSVIARNDRPRSYKVLNVKGNLIIINCRHLIPTNEKFIVKRDYENIIEPSKTTPWKTVAQPRTDIPSNIATASIRTKSGRIIRTTKRNLEEC